MAHRTPDSSFQQQFADRLRPRHKGDPALLAESPDALDALARPVWAGPVRLRLPRFSAAERRAVAGGISPLQRQLGREVAAFLGKIERRAASPRAASPRAAALVARMPVRAAFLQRLGRLQVQLGRLNAAYGRLRQRTGDAQLLLGGALAVQASEASLQVETLLGCQDLPQRDRLRIEMAWAEVRRLEERTARKVGPRPTSRQSELRQKIDDTTRRIELKGEIERLLAPVRK